MGGYRAGFGNQHRYYVWMYGDESREVCYPNLYPLWVIFNVSYSYVQKYALWGGFNIAQAAVLSPLLFLQPAILAQAGLYTVAMMGSIAFVGATAKQEKYLYLGGPLLAGVAIVAVSGFAPLVLPATAIRTLVWTERLWLYGGLAVFGGFTLYDVQKILYHARMANQGLIQKDTVNESIHLELDFLNSKYAHAFIKCLADGNLSQSSLDSHRF